jgi:hypothetical protein
MTSVFLTIGVMRITKACLCLHANAIVKKAIVKPNFDGNGNYEMEYMTKQTNGKHDLNYKMLSIMFNSRQESFCYLKVLVPK